MVVHSNREQQEYWDEWYSAHGDSWNAHRRKRYRTDLGYREKVKESARLSRRRATRDKNKISLYSGDVVDTHKIATVADAVGVALGCLRAWERAGAIPEPHRLVGECGEGQRSYTEDQIALLKTFARKVRRPSGSRGRRHSGDQKVYEAASSELWDDWQHTL
jgi:hypothetical protein